METEFKPGRIKAVALDLYGTLVNNAGMPSFYRKLCNRLGMSEEETTRARLMAMKENFASLADLGQRLNPDVLIDYAALDREIGVSAASVALFPETIGVLEKLKKRKLKLGLISNLATPFKAVLRNLEIEKYFDEIVFSCDVGYVKPQPEIYVLMINQLGYDPHRIIMTGDQALNDCEIPKSLGMKGVHLDRTGQKPGSIATLDDIFRYL